MIKMIIKMNEDKITTDNTYSVEHVYDVLDNVFAQFGYSKESVDGNLEYKGNNDARDFGKFGRIYSGLRKQSWFMDNASTWLLCNSDDVDDPNDFSVEDLLHYDRSRITAGAY